MLVWGSSHDSAPNAFLPAAFNDSFVVFTGLGFFCNLVYRAEWFRRQQRQHRSAVCHHHEGANGGAFQRHRLAARRHLFSDQYFALQFERRGGAAVQSFGFIERLDEQLTEA